MTTPGGTVATSSTRSAPPAAVLWDMDGTLVDTEPYWMAAERRLVEEFGGRWTDADAASVVGFELIRAAGVLRDHGVALGAEEIVHRLQGAVMQSVRRRIVWRPGARRLLAELRREGVPCALVTMSWAPLADLVLEALPAGSFQAVVTGDMVARGKPDPEPYRLAAARLGVDPVECVAIEDSPTGIRSARGAGCVVLAVPNHVDIPAALADRVTPTLDGVTPEALGELVAATPAPPTAAAANGGPTPPADRSLDRRWVVAGALVALLAAVVAGFVLRGGEDRVRQPGALLLHTWVPYWTVESALEHLEDEADAIHQLSPFWFSATGVDTIALNPNAPEDETAAFLDRADDLDIPLVASILDGTAPGTMAAILGDEATRARHVDAIVAFAAEGDWAGIDLDYEQFAFADGRDTWPTTRPGWVAFVEQLADRLHAAGRTLTVSIPPVYDAGQTDDSGFWVYDYASIAPHVDAIRVMAYDYSVDAPGPIAPLDWVRRVIAGTTEASGDASKLVLGVPLYGRNWVVATDGECPESAPGTESVTNRAVDDLVQRRGATPVYDPTTGEWSFTYDVEFTDDTTSCIQTREVHYVDDDGVQQRIQLSLDAGLGGVALFALGYDDQEVWNGIAAINATLAAAATTTE